MERKTHKLSWNGIHTECGMWLEEVGEKHFQKRQDNGGEIFLSDIPTCKRCVTKCAS